MSSRVVFLFTKPARPGKVKTRLIGPLSAREAAELHSAFLDDILAELGEGQFELRLAWALDGDEKVPTAPVAGIRQEGTDLGERLYRALERGCREAPTVAAVGSDHPELSHGVVEEAFALLEGREADVVLGPALDGGYYLIAVQSESLTPELFRGIPWSTSRVLADTLERCTRLGLCVCQLEPAGDVDTPADLERLARAIAAGTVRSPRAASLLNSWGRLGALEG